jgi:hypothetical protein
MSSLSIQNQFEVPITLYQVETHIPVELIDVNAPRRVPESRSEFSRVEMKGMGPIYWIKNALHRRAELIRAQTGIAVAMGTLLSEKEEREFLRTEIPVTPATELAARRD